MAYYFKLPENLTVDQQRALNDPKPIRLYGGPGTGKTVVNLWRHIRNHEQGVNSLLLTYTKTLEHYLSYSAKEKNEKASTHVNRTYKWTYGKTKSNYDEIIVDEAQDVETDRYAIIKKYAKSVSYGADPDQGVYHSPEVVRSIINSLKGMYPNNSEHTLYKNFRNSKEILLFTQEIFPDIVIERETIKEAESHNLPFVSVAGWEQADMISKISEIVEVYSSETSNIGILLPTQKQVIDYYEYLKDKFKCSRFQSEQDIFEGLENIHITTFKSAKGIEFDTVIIPNFDSYDWFINNTNVSMNEYYVALTRAKTNLFLVCKNNLNGINNATYQSE